MVSEMTVTEVLVSKALNKLGFLYCAFCDSWTPDNFEESEQDPRCPRCERELSGFDPEYPPGGYDTLEEKYL